MFDHVIMIKVFVTLLTPRKREKTECWLLGWGVPSGRPISDDRKKGRENIILYSMAQTDVNI